MTVHNNYCSYYYNNDPTQLLRTSLDDRWDLHFADFEKTAVGSLKQETLRVCGLIYEKFGLLTPSVNLFYSGGMDSECVLRCFVELKIPVTPIVIIHKHHQNSYETELALHTCKTLGVTPKIFHLDLLELYASGTAFALGEKYQTTRMGRIELLHVLDLLKEPAILVDEITLNFVSSDHDMISKDEVSKQQWFFELEEDIFGALNNFELLTNIPLVNEPFKYTPACWAALMGAPSIRDIVVNRRGKTSSNSTKNIMMSKEFGVMFREKTNVFSNSYYTNVTAKLSRELLPVVYPATITKIEYHKLLSTLAL